MRRRTRRPASPPASRPARPPRQVIFAPWRIAYIKDLKSGGCFFCEAAGLAEGDEAAWRSHLLLQRTAEAVVVMNRYPYTGGHLLIAPRRHTRDFARLSPDEQGSLWGLLRRCVAALEEVLQPHGLNTGMNLGRAGGAGVEDHLHLHVVPRWVGDTNFIPVIAQTHSIPIALEELWDELRPIFKRPN